MKPNIFDLDKDRLDEEWVEQPKLYHQQAEKLADARAEWERAKAERDVVTAEIDQDVRSNPAKYGMEKITEGAVEKKIVLQSRFSKANEKVIQAKHAVDVIQAMIDALDHRKKALESLVQLHLANYFSSPKIRGDAGKEMVEVERRETRSSRSPR